jgi:nucleoside phosphorylase
MMTSSKTLSRVDDSVELTNGLAKVDVLCVSNMGNVNSGIHTAFNISRRQPRYVILCGIAGGIPSGPNFALGDIIVADQIVLYEASKIRRKRFWPGHDIERRFSSFPAGAILLRTAKHLHVDMWPAVVMKQLQRERAGRSAPRVVFAPVASGEKVVADRSFLDPLTQAYPLLKGIEMEGGGVMSAAHNAGYACESIVVKSVCDWADHHKNDDWHEAASYAAAAFVKHLVDHLATSLDPAARQVFSISAAGQIESTTAGLFIEFLNPESQRIYRLDQTLPPTTRAEQARIVVNAALFLCDRGVVFPIGTVLETPYLMDLLPEWIPLIEAQRIRFSMRESSINDFLEKRRDRYQDQRAEYPALFDDPAGNVRQALSQRAFVSKESHIGKRIAELFSLGPRNLEEWNQVVSQHAPEEVEVISSIPRQLLSENRPVTWTAFKARLAEHSIEPSFELRRLLQLTYCNIYVSEYGLEYLRNVEFAPLGLLPPSEIRRYDYLLLKRVLAIGDLWDHVVNSDAAGMLRMHQMSAYRSFTAAYDDICRGPMSDTDVDVLVHDLRRLAANSSRTSLSNSHVWSPKERLIEAMSELCKQLARSTADRHA